MTFDGLKQILSYSMNNQNHMRHVDVVIHTHTHTQSKPYYTLTENITAGTAQTRVNGLKNRKESTMRMTANTRWWLAGLSGIAEDGAVCFTSTTVVYYRTRINHYYYNRFGRLHTT